MDFKDFPKHHAVLVTHFDRTAYAARLWSDISALSPIHRHFNQTVLDIETARNIISFAQSPYNGEKIALISFHTASIPAQNAMLKVLEDPRGDMRFVIVTTHASNLIDTVLSRVQHLTLEDGSQNINEKHAREFLSTSPSFRMKLSFVIDILSRVDEEERKDREAVKGFILSLVDILKEIKAQPHYISETLEIASYASDSSASGKALLEYLSLLLPQTK